VSLRGRILGAESRWVMGRVMAGDFLEGVGESLPRTLSICADPRVAPSS
jgi:hypothetical protein